MEPRAGFEDWEVTMLLSNAKHFSQGRAPMALKIYLAGPDVFLADARAVGERKKALCQEFGFDSMATKFR